MIGIAFRIVVHPPPQRNAGASSHDVLRPDIPRDTEPRAGPPGLGPRTVPLPIVHPFRRSGRVLTDLEREAVRPSEPLLPRESLPHRKPRPRIRIPRTRLRQPQPRLETRPSRVRRQLLEALVHHGRHRLRVREHPPGLLIRTPEDPEVRTDRSPQLLPRVVPAEVDVVSPIAHPDRRPVRSLPHELERRVVPRIVRRQEEAVPLQRLGTRDPRGHMVQRHLPDRVVRQLRDQIRVSLLPHARKDHRRPRRIHIPRIAVLKPHLLRPVEHLRAVDVQVALEVVHVTGQFRIVGQRHHTP